MPLRLVMAKEIKVISEWHSDMTGQHWWGWVPLKKKNKQTILFLSKTEIGYWNSRKLSCFWGDITKGSVPSWRKEGDLKRLGKWKTYKVWEVFLSNKAKGVLEVTYAIMAAEERRLLAEMPACCSGNSRIRSHQSPPGLAWAFQCHGDLWVTVFWVTPVPVSNPNTFTISLQYTGVGSLLWSVMWVLLRMNRHLLTLSQKKVTQQATRLMADRGSLGEKSV